MEEFLFYVSGCVTFIVFYFLYTKFVVKQKASNKLILYRSLKYGIFSWFAVLFMLVLVLVGWIYYLLFTLDEKIENALK